jgi:hypothetical protein
VSTGRMKMFLPRYMYQESALSRIISLKHFLFCAELKIKLIFHNNLQPYTNQDGDECGIPHPA